MNRKISFEQLESRKLLAVVVDDIYEVPEDSSLVVRGNDSVIANDIDVSKVVLGDGPLNGLLIFNQKGHFGYQPNANFFGEDSFTYRDVNGTDFATVTINVIADDSGADAVDDAYTVIHDGMLRVRYPDEVIANDTNIRKVSLSKGAEHGTVSLFPDGRFNYIPDDNFAGTDSFSYFGLGTNGGGDVATVTITVTNEIPVAVEESYTTAEDRPLTVEVVDGVLANDTDADGDNLSAIVVTEPAHGTLDLNVDTGEFTYTPDADFFGEDSFTYTASDGVAASNEVTVLLTVTPINDAPWAQPDTYDVNSYESLWIAAPGLLANDIDADGDVLTAALTREPEQGTAVVNADGSFTYTPVSADEDYVVTFEYSATDTTGSVGLSYATINVKAWPVAQDDRYDILENSTFTGSVLDNDLSFSGGDVTIVSEPEHGLFVFDNGEFIYQPDADFQGQDGFSYIISNGDYESYAEAHFFVHADFITESANLDFGFGDSDQLAAGDLDEGVETSRQMYATILDAINAGDLARDGQISVEDVFSINNWIIESYATMTPTGDPIWIDASGNELTRELNNGLGHYYDGIWANWYGDDAGGRQQFGTTGDQIEHGYHLIQNDGGLTTLVGGGEYYGLDFEGGSGVNLWTTVLDGIFHMGGDIVEGGDDVPLIFADEYNGENYYFLGEDGNRNASLNDVADWLTVLLHYPY